MPTVIKAKMEGNILMTEESMDFTGTKTDPVGHHMTGGCGYTNEDIVSICHQFYFRHIL